ncbi:SGNH hydrolase-type esterase domain-containing protein [Aspergillus navahoensis]
MDIPPQVEPHAAIRSGNNYGSLLAQELGANHIDLTVSGATPLNILSEPQTTVLDNQTFPPQIPMLPEDADIVTITAGGNDFGYISGMLTDAWKDSKPGNLTATLGDNASQSISALESQPAPQEPNLSPEKLSQRLGNALDSIHKRAPKARVFLVEYMAVLGPLTQPGVDVPFNQSKIDIYSQMADVLHNAYKLAAKTRAAGMGTL